MATYIQLKNTWTCTPDIKSFLYEAIVVERRPLLVCDGSLGTWGWNRSLEIEPAQLWIFCSYRREYPPSLARFIKKLYFLFCILLHRLNQPLARFAAHFLTTWFCQELTIKHSAPASSSVHYSFYSHCPHNAVITVYFFFELLLLLLLCPLLAKSHRLHTHENTHCVPTLRSAWKGKGAPIQGLTAIHNFMWLRTTLWPSKLQQNRCSVVKQ